MHPWIAPDLSFATEPLKFNLQAEICQYVEENLQATLSQYIEQRRYSTRGGKSDSEAAAGFEERSF